MIPVSLARALRALIACACAMSSSPGGVANAAVVPAAGSMHADAAGPAVHGLIVRLRDAPDHATAAGVGHGAATERRAALAQSDARDRTSTRLNSSHRR